ARRRGHDATSFGRVLPGMDGFLLIMRGFVEFPRDWGGHSNDNQRPVFRSRRRSLRLQAADRRGGAALARATSRIVTLVGDWRPGGGGPARGGGGVVLDAPAG